MTHQPTPTVLVVDDDEDDRYLLQQAFEAVFPSVRVLYMASGEEASTYLGTCNRSPELLITDLNMPILSGHELIKQIRQANQHRALPIVVLSTSSASVDRDRCYGAGANAFLSKPMTMLDIVNQVRLIGRLWL
ncbi:response regulator [Spirosoma endbachense]|uniref:Response regulator n=1 Tax=Spirosoma endbachense TaxID=2666025 RepID=A0A6P1W6P5_9BACT|nr:response regulator [Spirosoma endbachense]QHV99386.1 response regulator [Spirosoma endbachense]